MNTRILEFKRYSRPWWRMQLNDLGLVITLVLLVWGCIAACVQTRAYLDDRLNDEYVTGFNKARAMAHRCINHNKTQQALHDCIEDGEE